MPILPLIHEGDNACPHCVLAEAVNVWRGTEGAAQYIREAREASPDHPATNDETMAVASIIGMAALMGELLGRLDPSWRAEVAKAYLDAWRKGYALGKAGRQLDTIIGGGPC